MPKPVPRFVGTMIVSNLLELSGKPTMNPSQPIAMSMQKRWANTLRCASAAVVLLASVNLALGQKARPADRQSSDGTEARGKYIVENLSRCGQCHTPHDSAGNADRSHWLQGAPVWLKSAEPVEDWPLQAPRIAGVLPGTDEEMIKLLTTGIWKTGASLGAPMPEFRMTSQDAEAVVAYLKSVQPSK
jgi:mono/diheme cytochrome c family protein